MSVGRIKIDVPSMTRLLIPALVALATETIGFPDIILLNLKSNEGPLWVISGH